MLMSGNVYTIPENIGFIKRFPGEMAEMNGPASPLACKSRVLALFMLPFSAFNPRIAESLDKKVAIQETKRTQSLGWALRAWCHSEGEPYTFQPDGVFVSAYRDSERYDELSPIISSYYSKFGWQLIRQNALIFDWNLRNVLTEFAINIPNTYMSVQQLSDSTGRMALVTTPNFDYSKNIVEQIEYLINLLDDTSLQIVKLYNQKRQQSNL